MDQGYELPQLSEREIKQMVKDVDSELFRSSSLIRCCESKLLRVEPLSDEYEDTIKLIEDTKAKVEKLAYKRLSLTELLNTISY